MDAQRRKILQRLNAFDAGPTQDDRRAERQATIRRAIEAEQDLKWGRLSARRSSQNTPQANFRRCGVALLGHHPRSARHRSGA
jgi:hypothetical protein